MRWLIWRELLIVTRTAAFWSALAFYLLVLTAYVLVWGDGIPVANADTPLRQFVFVQGVLLVAVLPWTALRCGTVRKSQLTLIASMTAMQPSRVVLARCLALVAVLFLLAMSALPLMIVMQQLTASPLTSLAGEVQILTVLSAFSAAAATAALLMFANRLHAWIAATAVALVAVKLVALNPLVWLAFAIALGVFAVMTADRQLTYLPDAETA